MKKLFLFTMMCLIGLFSLNAQTRAEVVIGGDGTETHNSSPTDTYYKYSFSQHIYTAAEINHAGGIITSLSFKMANPTTYLRKFDLYLANTEKTSFIDKDDWVAVTSDDLVFSGNVDFSAHVDGWITIEFENPFQYNGTNLLVCVDDNTANYQNNTYFTHYVTGTDRKTSIYITSDYSNYSPEDVATYGGAGVSENWSTGQFTSPAIKFEITAGALLPIAVKPEVIDLGYRPNGAWAPAQTLKVTSRVESLSIASITTASEYFQVEEVETPYELVKGTALELDVTHGTGEGEQTGVITIAYNDTVQTVELKAVAYAPKANDVFELAEAITTSTFTVTPDFNEIYNNYALPGSGTDGKDVVYKLTFENDGLVSANVNGANAKVALYDAEFGGKEGPMADNSIEYGNYMQAFVAAGEYYLVASATEVFTLNVEQGAAPVPTAAQMYQPWNNQKDVYAPVYFSWQLGAYTTEYQLLLGTTNPPTEVLVDWTSELADSYQLAEVKDATNYYWQIKSRNTTGVTESEVYMFTTELGIPANVKATPENIYEGDAVTISWDAVEDVIGYNVYVNYEKVNEEPVAETSYVIEDLGYAANGNTIHVTSVYEVGESYANSYITVFVAGKANVTVATYEQDGVEVVADAAVKFVGKDAIGNEQEYEFTVENGTCSGEIYAGEYVMTVESEGYQAVNRNVVVAYGEENVFNVMMYEIYHPVKWVKATSEEDVANVLWNINYETTDFEGFELGGLNSRDWNNTSEYPWAVTKDAYEGEFAIKSTNEGGSNSASTIELTVELEEAGFVGFYHKVSSEPNYDLGCFYVDNVLKATISGSKDWKYVETFVEAGTHVYKWEYSKDELTNTGLDAYYVDNITFYKAVEPFEGGWIHYDTGEFLSGIGQGQAAPTYWGASFPTTVTYEGLTLTKVAYYDSEMGGNATVTANIYLGGDTIPGTLVSTKDFTVSGASKMVEVELSTPVVIDGTQPLWITFYCDDLEYPASGCATVDNSCSDWISLDGKEWNHAYEYGLEYSWIVRGYLEDAEGKVRVVTSKDANPTFEGGVATGEYVAKVAGAPVEIGVPETSRAASADRAFASKYNVYKKNVNTNAVELIAEETAESSFVDSSWADFEVGAYKYGVTAFYEGNRAMKTVFEEDFENGTLPQGWTVYCEDISGYGGERESQNWTVGTSYVKVSHIDYMETEYTPYRGEYFAYSPADYYGNIERYYLVTEQINVQQDAAISFMFRNPGDEPYYFSNMYFSVSESPTGPWTDIWATQEYVGITEWTEATIDLSEYVGQKLYFAFIHQFGWSYGGSVQLDDVKMVAQTPESDIVWSNTIDKGMSTTVTVSAATDTELSVAGTSVNFVNVNEPEYNVKAEFGKESTITFEDFRKGTYIVTIAKEGYTSSYDGVTVEIWDETSISCDLYESFDAVKDLYVSPTGWVMWDGKPVGAGDEFSFNFEDGTLDGWVTIDNDKDNNTWMTSYEYLSPGSGHNSDVCVMSMSYMPAGGPLTPDNYLVTAKRYNIGEASRLRFWVCAQDKGYPQEHYGVAISLGSNTSAEDFTTIWEETLSAKSGNTTATRGTTEQGTWYEKVVDLSDYAGLSVYIALRHFDCTDMFFLNIDDVSLENEVKNNRPLSAYQVYLDGELVTEDLQVPYYQHEDLIIGKEYTTTVVPVYNEYDEGSDASYTWRYLGCENYQGVTAFSAEYINNETVVNWTMPVIEDEEEGGEKAARTEGAWLTYDDGEYVEKIGLTYDGENFEPFKWAVMFPAADVADYANHFLTKVSVYDCDEYDGEVAIYEGGTSEPGTLLYSQSYTFTNTEDYRDIELEMPVKLSGNQNVWVVLSTENGKQPASGCEDNGNPNSRWLYYEGYGWLDLAMVSMPAFSWQISAYVTETTETVVPSTSEMLGVMLYRNGELVSQLAQGGTYTDKNAYEGDEYAVRVVYGGEKDMTYYAMSCPETTEVVYNMPCKAPKDLHAQSMAYADGTFGALLSYPFVAPTSEWLYYDDGECINGIGGPSSYYWGVMFPVESLESYAGTEITKVSFYDYAAQSGTINIYYGGTTSPEVLVHSQPFTATGSQVFVEHQLTYPLPVDGDMSIWVVLGTVNGENYPSAQAATIGNPNARWISMDGQTWEDAGNYDLDGTWMIRAFVTNESKGGSTQLEAIEFVNTATGGTPMADPNPSKAPTLKHYNIYRGTSLENVEVIAETKDKTYFDEVEKGTYYYQVTAVYEENGEECESTPAKAYLDKAQDYVVVDVTSISENGVNGMMIYPNPTQGDLNISVEAMKRITITNALGQMVYDKEVDSDNEIINMARYEAGVYMVRIVTETGVAVKRINVVR